jgi:signal transduction histidine kinase/DNA-binding response OmpR family regulator
MTLSLAVLDRIALLAVLTEQTGEVRYVNRAAEETGLLEAGDVFSPKLLPQGVRSLRAPTENGRFTTAVDASSGRRLIEWSTSELPDGAILYTGQDVTRDRKNVAMLKELARNASNTSDAKMRFLATMSHEMRTPLNGILGMTGLLLDTRLDPNQQTYAEAVRESGLALLALINDILDYSKIEAGRMEIEEQVFNPAGLLQSIAELLSPRCAQKGLEIASYVAPDVPARLVGDEARLRQVLLNLAGNGVKFTEKGGVSLELRRGSGGDDDRPHLRFDVRDTGVGIAPDDVERIFEEFTQVDDSTARGYEGTGLGLSIAQRIVNAMGGSISVRSEPGRGSTFSFTISLAHGAPEMAPTIYPPLSRQVVVATDNAFLRDILSLQLDAVGVSRILHAASPTEAARHLERSPEAALLCDLPFAASDGARLAGLCDNAIVLLSPVARGRLEAFKRAGFAGYLIKPIRPESLAERLGGLGRADSTADRLDTREIEHRPAASRRLRVLLAEDNQINAVLATAILKRAGHRVDTAGNGREAVETFALAPYDIVLMDMRMPVMDGLEATRRIRADVGPDVPVIALTANATNADREECLSAGMNDFISKPFDPEDLLALIERWTEPGATAAASAG